MFATYLALAALMQPGDDQTKSSMQEGMRSMEKAVVAHRAKPTAEKMDPARYRELVEKSNEFARQIAKADDVKFQSVAEAALSAAVRSELGRMEEPTVGLVPVPVDSMDKPGVRSLTRAAGVPMTSSVDRDPEYLANFKFLREEAAKPDSDLFPLPPPGARIIGFGSRPALDTEFPDCVAVGSFGTNGPSYCCTGTLVTPNIVVTAGHCSECASDAAVFVGSDITRAGKVYRGRLIRHPEYATDKHHDISVIILNENVPNVTPRRIAPASTIDRARFVRAVGFGNTNAGGSRGYGIKRLVDIPIASTACSRSRDQSRYGCDRGLELIAIGPDHDTCTGDSGGPVYVRERGADGRWGEWMVAGATSRAIRNADNVCGDGGIYVRLDKYLNFMDRSAPGVTDPARPDEDRAIDPPADLRANVRGTITAPDGKKYKVLRSLERNAEVDREYVDEDDLRSSVPVEDRYKGKARRKAKLSVASASFETVPSVKKLIARLPRDEVMEELGISTGQNSGRVDEENRNYSVRAYLFAASGEDDRDFHLIIGDKGTRTKFMTVEISGLAADGSSPAELVQARKSFKALFGDLKPGNRYDFYDPPIPIDVAGSLFWDASHEAGTRPGPAQRKPATIFELHPVTKFEYAANGRSALAKE